MTQIKPGTQIKPEPSSSRACRRRRLRYPEIMFSIEHEFDATVVTLVDEGAPNLQEDVVLNAFDDCVTITQYDARSDAEVTITLSMTQVSDLAAALNLPEGIYRRKP
jgi:hypothetical protein